jgi:hypothetical protein
MQPNQASDPVIDEVRAVRHRISAECGHDPERLVAYYMQLQQQFRDRLVKGAAPPNKLGNSNDEPVGAMDRAG